MDELVRLGADIRVQGRMAVVDGVSRLSGAPVKCPDLRGGAALVIAALAAQGQTLVEGCDHIARGYQDLAATLTGLGAKVREAAN